MSFSAAVSLIEIDYPEPGVPFFREDASPLPPNHPAVIRAASLPRGRSRLTITERARFAGPRIFVFHVRKHSRDDSKLRNRKVFPRRSSIRVTSFEARIRRRYFSNICLFRTRTNLHRKILSEYDLRSFFNRQTEYFLARIF